MLRMLKTQRSKSITSTTLLILLLACSTAVISKNYTVGISAWTGYPENIRGFKESLSKHGLKEGENVIYLYAESGINKEKQYDIARQFKQKNVDLVYSLTTPGTTIIKEIIPQSTPIVFSIVTYPADSGLIESFDYSANNLVGTSNFIPYKHYVTLLQNLLPTTRKVAIFHRKNEPNSKIQAINLRRLLKYKNISVHDMEPSDLRELKLMAEKLAGQVDVFITTTDSLMQSGGEEVLIEIAKKHNIPIMSSNKSGIEKGATFGPVADFYTLGKESGVMASKILLQNKEPASLESKVQDLPLILINRTSINKLGIKIPTKIKQIKFVD